MFRTLRRWQPQSLLFVAAPGSDRFQVPTEHEVLATVISSASRRRALVGVTSAAFLVVACLCAWLVVPSRVLLAAAFSLTMGAVLIAFDQWIALRTPAQVNERARFLYWIRTASAGRVGVAFWMAFLIVIAGVQVGLIDALGSNDAAFARIGAMYERIARGEWWRFASGPYLHYSVLHYINNFFLLLLIGSLAWATIGRAWSVGVFALGNALGAMGQMSFGGHAYDSTGGISFGIYALFGLVIVAGRSSRGRLPNGFAVLVALVAGLCIGASELVSGSTATAGHVCGLLAGACSGLMVDLTAARPAVRAPRST